MKKLFLVLVSVFALSVTAMAIEDKATTVDKM